MVCVCVCARALVYELFETFVSFYVLCVSVCVITEIVNILCINLCLHD